MTSKLITFWPGNDRPVYLTHRPYESLVVFGTDVQGERVYFYSDGDAEDRIDLYWMTGNVHPLAKNVPSPIMTGFWPMIVTTPDMEWLFYAQAMPEGTYTEWATNTHTGQHINISRIIQPANADGRGGHFFSEDKKWLYVTAWNTPPNSTLDIFRISLQNQTAENLTTKIAEQATLDTYHRTPDWLFFYSDSRLYQMHPDGSDQRLVVPNDKYITSPPPDIDTETIINYFPESGIALVGNKQQMWAVELDSGQVLWDDESQVRWFWLPTQPKDWILVQNTDGTFARRFVTDGHVVALPADWSAENFRPLTLRSDGDTMLYMVSNTDFLTFDLALINLSTGQQAILHQNLPGGAYPIMSPDSQWMFWATGGSNQNMYRLHLSDGRLEKLGTIKMGSQFVGWICSPLLQWQPVFLALIAMGCLVASKGTFAMFHRLR